MMPSARKTLLEGVLLTLTSGTGGASNAVATAKDLLEGGGNGRVTLAVGAPRVSADEISRTASQVREELRKIEEGMPRGSTIYDAEEARRRWEAWERDHPGKKHPDRLAEERRAAARNGHSPRRVNAHRLTEATLSAADRHALPKSAFVFPEREAYPIHDEGHARAALARVAQHGNPEEKAKVRAAVKAKYPKLLQEAATTADMPETCRLPHEKMAKRGKRICPGCKKPLKLEEAALSRGESAASAAASRKRWEEWDHKHPGLRAKASALKPGERIDGARGYLKRLDPAKAAPADHGRGFHFETGDDRNGWVKHKTSDDALKHLLAAGVEFPAHSRREHKIADTISQAGVARVKGVDTLRLAHMMKPSESDKTLHFGSLTMPGADTSGMMKTNQEMKAGKTVTLRGHHSMSGNADVANSYSGSGSVVHLEVPKGTPMMRPNDINHRYGIEDEHVLPHGTRVKIERTEKIGGKTHHYGRVVPRSLQEAMAAAAGWEASYPLEEAKDSLAKASTPEPFSASKTSNWVARAGGLPPYIQHIAHDLVEKRGKTVSNAIQMAIGIVKNWASGKGNVDANTRAAASKAVAEWEKLKAKNAASKAGKAALQEALGSNWHGNWKGYEDAARVLAEQLEESELELLEARVRVPVTEPKQKPMDVKVDASERVKHLQSRLGSLGFDCTPDGRFGPKTADCVREFQRNAGLREDGIVGPVTTEALRSAPHPDEMADADQDGVPDSKDPDTSAGAPANTPKTPAGGPGPKTPDRAAGTPKITRASERAAASSETLLKGMGVGEPKAHEGTRHLQADLGHLGYDLSVDGRFGPETEKSVKRFQKKYGLKTDGIAGPKTARVIAGVKRKKLKLAEAVLIRKAATGSDFTRAFAAERVLRRHLEEGFNAALLVASALSSDEELLFEVVSELEEANAGMEAMIAKLIAAGLPEEQAKAVVAKNFGGAPEVGGAKRGEKAKAKVELKRLPDGQFAPKGTGQVLHPGQVVSVPHTSGTGTVEGVVGADGKVKLKSGPDKGTHIDMVPGNNHLASEAPPDLSNEGGMVGGTAPGQPVTPDAGEAAPSARKDIATYQQQPAGEDWNGPEIGSKIKDKNGTEAEVTAHHDHASGDPEKKKFTVTHANGDKEKLGYQKLGDIYGGQGTFAKGGSAPAKEPTGKATTTPVEKNKGGGLADGLIADPQGQLQPGDDVEVNQPNAPIGSGPSSKGYKGTGKFLGHDPNLGTHAIQVPENKNLGFVEGDVIHQQPAHVKKAESAPKAKPVWNEGMPATNVPNAPKSGDVKSKFGAGGSPGRGPTGKLRNFKAMSGPKLKKTIADLEAFGQDQEALDAAKAMAQAKGVAWNDGAPAKPKDDMSLIGILDKAPTASAAGRSTSEKNALRTNFEKMGKPSLAKTIEDLQASGDDDEALGLAKEAAQKKGITLPTQADIASGKYTPEGKLAGDPAQAGAQAEAKKWKGDPGPSALAKGGPKKGGGKGPSGSAVLPETMGPNVGGYSLHELPLGAQFTLNDGTAYHTHKFVGDPWMIAKPLDGGKAKPFHKMLAPANIGPQVEGYEPGPGGTAGSGTPPVTSPAGGGDDLYDQLAASVDAAKGKKAAAPAAAPGGGETAAAANAALEAYLAGGGNDPTLIQILKAKAGTA